MIFLTLGDNVCCMCYARSNNSLHSRSPVDILSHRLLLCGAECGFIISKSLDMLLCWLKVSILHTLAPAEDLCEISTLKQGSATFVRCKTTSAGMTAVILVLMR